MNILIHKPLAKNLEFDSDMMWVELIDGRKFLKVSRKISLTSL
ncbi:hypothetical protein BGP_0256 [Beggiatoa sp. PS]|nr:hypothetical protein BGP_0256 [Beggiatoa sp. PS]